MPQSKLKTPLLLTIVVLTLVIWLPRPSPAQDKNLWVIPFKGHEKAEMVLAQTMQGLSGRTSPNVWLETDGMSAEILSQLEHEGWQLHRVESVWQLPDQFWKQHPSFIAYRADDTSLNIATSLCALYNAVAVSEELSDRAKAKGLKQLFTAVGRQQLDVFLSYKNHFSRSIAIDQSLEKAAYLRDFAVANNAFMFTADKDQRFRAQVASELLPGASIFGWGPDEFGWISAFSHYGCQGISSDWCVNLSALSKLPVSLPAPPKQSVPAPAKQGERIVAFLLSDGDNVEWLNGKMAFDPKYFANPHRGSFAMNWGLSPTLATLSPRTLAYFYANAKPGDSFFAMGSPGYRYIHDEPEPKGDIDARQSQSLLRASRLNIVTIINTNEGQLKECAPLLSLPEVDGVVHLSYSPYNRLAGQIFWHIGKPAIAAKFMLWDNKVNCDPLSVAKLISGLPNSPQSDPNSYAVVIVHAWSFDKIGGPIEAVRQTIGMLPNGTRVVSIQDLCYLLRQHCRR